MKVHTIPDSDSLAAISIEPGEKIILRSKQRLAQDDHIRLRNVAEQALPDVHIAIVGPDFDVFVVENERKNIAPHNTMQPSTVTETRDSGVTFAETRTFQATEIRVAKGDDGKMHVTGHAAVFNSRSKPLKTKAGKMFVEQIQPGAFKRSLENNPDIVMLDEHDPKKILARSSTGTLKLKEDERGLKFDATLPDTTTARDLAQNIDHGNVRGVSFGFNEPEDRWDMDGDIPVRTLLSVPLGEVSATAFPAYEATDINVRSIDVALQQLELGEKEVRGAMVHLSHVRSMADNCRSECRSAFEVVHQTHEALRTNANPLDEHEKRSLRNLHEEAGNLRAKLGELRSYLRSALPDEGSNEEHNEEEGELPDNPPPEHDRDRAIAKIQQQIRTNLEFGLPIDDLRESLAAVTAPKAPEAPKAEEATAAA